MGDFGIIETQVKLSSPRVEVRNHTRKREAIFFYG